MARRRRPRGQGDELRAELLDAAEELLAEHGDDRPVTVRAIVDRVGVTPPSLYRHFADKDELVAAVVSRRFLALAEAIRHATTATAARGDAPGSLRAGCLAYLDWARENPGGYTVLFRAQHDAAAGAAASTSGSVAFDTLVDGIRACQAAGAAAGDGDPHVLAAVVWASLHGMATLTVLRPDFPWPPLTTMVDELLRGVVGTPS